MTDTTQPDLAATLEAKVEEAAAVARSVVDAHGLHGDLAKAAKFTILARALGLVIVENSDGVQADVLQALRLAAATVADSASLAFVAAYPDLFKQAEG